MGWECWKGLAYHSLWFWGSWNMSQWINNIVVSVMVQNKGGRAEGSEWMGWSQDKGGKVFIELYSFIT